MAGRKKSLTNGHLNTLFKEAVGPTEARSLAISGGQTPHYIKPHPKKFQCFTCEVDQANPARLGRHYRDFPGHAPTDQEVAARVRYEVKARGQRRRRKLAREKKFSVGFRPTAEYREEAMVSVPQTVNRAVAGDNFIVLFPTSSTPIVISVTGPIERGY